MTHNITPEAVESMAYSLLCRAEAAEAANLRFYRAGIEVGALLAARLEPDAKVSAYIHKTIRALPDPTPESQDKIRKGETT